jgi:amino acid adenylation domain-containing protein
VGSGCIRSRPPATSRSPTACVRAVGAGGVDIVLNSLHGEFIPASLRLLKPGGRFIEIGKRGIWTHAQVAAEFPTVEYFPFDLDQVISADPELGKELAADVLSRISVGLLEPLPVREFSAPEVRDAFRYMAMAKHVGKVVVTFDAAPAVRVDAPQLGAGHDDVGGALPSNDAADGVIPPLASRPGGGTQGGVREHIEEILRDVLGSILDIKDRADIAMELEFLSLGVDSLLAEQLRHKLEQETGCSLTNTFIHDYPTLSELVDHLEATAEISLAPLLRTRPAHAHQPDNMTAPVDPGTPASGEPHASCGESSGTRPQPQPRTGGLFPLSRAQERMWFSHLRLAGSAAYTEYAGLRIKGRLSSEQIRGSLQSLMDHEEVLRTCFRQHQGRLMQVVLPYVECPLEEHDLRAAPAAEREQRCWDIARAAASRCFDLAAPPLFAATAIRMGDADRVLVFAAHHIVIDGQSYVQLVRRFLDGCVLLARGEALVQPLHRISYADYAVWDRQPNRCRDAGMDYWLHQLAGVTTGTELPLDLPRPAQASGRGRILTPVLDASLTEAIRQYAQRTATTPYMVMLSAFEAMLYHLAGETDCTVGTAIADRPLAELETAFGMFVSTVAIRVQIDPDASFEALLRRVEETVISAQRHRDVDFQGLIQRLALQRDASRNPLFQIVFDLQRFGDELFAVDEYEAEYYFIDNATAKFDLVFGFREYRGELLGRIEYATDLFRNDRVLRIIACYEQCLRHVLARPDGRVREIELLDENLRQQVLARSAGVVTPLPRCAGVIELFERHAARAPDAAAIASEDRALTYGELNARANELASHLRRTGIGRGDFVAVLLPRSLEQCVAVLATVKSGAAYVPLDPSLPTARLELMLDDVQPAALLTSTSARPPALGAAGAAVVLLDQPAWRGGGPESNLPAIDGALADPLYVIYTSGSTGRPKGVLVPNRGLVNLVNWHHRAFGVSASDRASMCANVGFDASIWEFWSTLTAGASLHLAPDHLTLTVAPLIQWLSETGITIAFLPTPVAERVLERPWPSVTALRLLLTGGDRLHAPPAWTPPFDFVNNYGPSEYSVVATSGVVAPGSRDAVATQPRPGTAPSIGRPIDNTRLYIMTPGQRLVPEGIAGEICLGGAGLSLGYLGDDSLSRGAFVPDPYAGDGQGQLYRTGDRGRQCADGTIEYLGRLDHQVKVRGCRIELGEVESVMRRLPSVEDACVCAESDPSGAVRLRGFVIAPATSTNRIRDSLSDQLPDYMIPATIQTVDAIPLSANGKVDRMRLLAMTPADAAPEPRPPVDACAEESALSQIFSELLHLAEVDRDASFFELGGHSLLVAHLVEQVRQRLGRELSLQDVFNAPSIAALARRLVGSAEVQAGDPGAADLVQLQPLGSKQPIYLVCPASGSPACYRELAVELDAERPVYGLRTPGLIDDRAPPESVEKLAEYFLGLILTPRPARHYAIGGWSFGAIVAWEMARQLEGRGVDVTLLLIDMEVVERSLSGAPSGRMRLHFSGIAQGAGNLMRTPVPRNYAQLRRLTGWIGMSLPASPRVFLQRDWRSSLRYLHQLLRAAGRSVRLFKHHFQCGAKYRFAPINARTVFFKTRRHHKQARDARMLERLRALVRGESQVKLIPGNHMTVFEMPQRRVLADALRAALDGERGSPSADSPLTGSRAREK